MTMQKLKRLASSSPQLPTLMSLNLIQFIPMFKSSLFCIQVSIIPEFSLEAL